MKLFAVSVVLSLFTVLQALELPCFFGDHMVLQRDQELRIGISSQQYFFTFLSSIICTLLISLYSCNKKYISDND